MIEFLRNNQPYLVLAICIIALVILVFAILTHKKSARLEKSMLVNKFRVVDMFEQNTADNAPLYTIIVSNNSMNAISIASVGFENDGNYFNYRNECKVQLDTKNLDLAILPRGSIKLRLYKEQLEGVVFKMATTKNLKKVRVYIIGLGGESYRVKAKVIGKKMKESYKEYYNYHKPEIMAKFVSACTNKLSAGVKVSLFDKIKLKIWSKKVDVDKLPATELPNWKSKAIPGPETKTASNEALNACDLENPTPEAVNDVPTDTTNE